MTVNRGEMIGAAFNVCRDDDEHERDKKKAGRAND